jgi:hypothetical protein
MARTKYRTKTNKEAEVLKGVEQGRAAAKQNRGLQSSEASLRRSFEGEI